MAKGKGGYSKPWTDEEYDMLVKLYLEDKSNYEIALAVGKTQAAVKAQIVKVRKERNLPYRDKAVSYMKRRDLPKIETEFDRAYHGSIPCGHWLITKPWSKRA